MVERRSGPDVVRGAVFLGRPGIRGGKFLDRQQRPLGAGPGLGGHSLLVMDAWKSNPPLLVIINFLGETRTIVLSYGVKLYESAVEDDFVVCRNGGDSGNLRSRGR